MRFPSLLAAACLVAAATSGPAAAAGFDDVPATHWAHDAVHRVAAAAGIEAKGAFRGESAVRRFQLAEVVARILAGAPRDLTAGARAELEELVVELSDELSALGIKVHAFEETRDALAGMVDTLKAGSGTRPAGRRDPFSGFVSVGLVATDDGFGGSPTAGVPLTRFSWIPDQTFFTVPQVSIALDPRVGDGLALHMQLDYDTDGTNLPAFGVGFNEVYLTVDRLFGGVGAKLGAFALPFQSWEWDGPFRTLTWTINPSVIGDFFEQFRPVGIELSPAAGREDAAVRWRMGVFSGADSSASPGLGFASDFITNQQLLFSPRLDDEFGFYVDLESGQDPARDFGWRVGAFVLGGDPGLPPVPPASASSAELDGRTAGVWKRFRDLTVTAQWLEVDGDGADFLGPASDLEADAWYLLLAFRIDSRWSVALRRDAWRNDRNLPTGDLEGESWVFAVHRQVSATSKLQLEYQAPDEEDAASPGLADFDDDLLQLRYSVWF